MKPMTWESADVIQQLAAAGAKIEQGVRNVEYYMRFVCNRTTLARLEGNAPFTVPPVGAIMWLLDIGPVVVDEVMYSYSLEGRGTRWLCETSVYVRPET